MGAEITKARHIIYRGNTNIAGGRGWNAEARGGGGLAENVRQYPEVTGEKVGPGGCAEMRRRQARRTALRGVRKWDWGRLVCRGFELTVSLWGGGRELVKRLNMWENVAVIGIIAGDGFGASDFV
jgi:hypothetical protein